LNEIENLIAGDPQSEEKTYLFLAKNVSLDTSSEEIQASLSQTLNSEVKVYRAYQKEHVYFTLLDQ
jgi:hypothetical protein